MLEIRELGPGDEAAFLQGLKDWAGESPHWHSFAWKEGMTYPEMLVILADDRAGRNLPPGRVPHTMLYGFQGTEIVGRVSVRHTLNDKLRLRGGHIGYAVAPRFRKRGYAKELVQSAFIYCRGLGLSEVMITCGDENVPSWKIIEAYGGVMRDKIWDEEDKETIRRYWVQL